MTYLKFISMAFQRSMAYRIEYFTAILNAFLYIFIFTSVWQALIPEGESMNGLSRSDMIRYAVLSTLIKVSFGRNDSLLSSRVRSGEIAVDLMKPFSFPMMYFSDTIGSSLFQLFARAIPLLIFSIFFFDMSLNVTLSTFLYFLPLYLLSFILFFAMAFCISSSSFYFTDIFPFWIFYYAVITFASGAIIPLDFLPETIRNVLNASPFPYLFYYPTMALVGKLPIPYPELLGNYVIQVCGAIAVATFSYTMGLRKLSIAGG